MYDINERYIPKFTILIDIVKMTYNYKNNVLSHFLLIDKYNLIDLKDSILYHQMYQQFMTYYFQTNLCAHLIFIT